MSDWGVGETISNRWEIFKILRGGMGIVYVVYDHHPEFQEPFAAKTFRHDLFVTDPTIAKRFVQEALVWVSLDVHPNVVQARFVQTVEGTPFIFLEYVHGGDLNRLVGSPQLTGDLSQVLRLAVQFCDGMNYAVSKGVKAHRDIKPQNCLLAQDGTLKVTDFGLAKAFDEVLLREPSGPKTDIQGLRIGLTRAGAGAGTCTHMAPEQFEDVAQVDLRADVYSFGVMLFQMATGRLPFLGQTWEDFRHCHQFQSPPKVNVGNAEFEGIINACLAKDPAKRFENFSVLRERLALLYSAVTNDSVPRPAMGTELNAVQWNNKGISLANMDRHENAISCYDRSIELSPRYELPWGNKGSSLAELGRFNDALNCCEHALQLKPLRADLWSIKGRILERLEMLGDALACDDHALELDPLNADSWSNKGILLSKLGRHAEAAKCHDRAIELAPGDWSLWSASGQSWYRSGEYEKAVPCFNRALQLNPHAEGVWHTKAHALDQMGAHKEALQCFDRVLQLNPREDKGWSGKGLVLKRLGRLTEALECYEHALALKPDNPKTWSNKGNALSGLGRTEEAVTCFDKALQVKPDSAVVWTNRGVALSNLGRLDEAIASFDRAIELDPTMTPTWFAKGHELAVWGRAREAKECFEKARELGGVSTAEEEVMHVAVSAREGLEAPATDVKELELIWDATGVQLGKLGELEQAIGWFDRVIGVNSNNERAWNNKGAALNRLGRFQDAIECCTRAISLNSCICKCLVQQGCSIGQSRSPRRGACIFRAGTPTWIRSGGTVDTVMQARDGALIDPVRALSVGPENR